MNKRAADMSRPGMKLPVERSRIPASIGPTCPPRFAMELIRAIPPAAAVPERNAGGIAQNGPCAPFTPAQATDSAVRARRG
jgi:hypothetical protein